MFDSPEVQDSTIPNMSQLLFAITTKDYIWIKLNKIPLGLPNDIFICTTYIRPRTSSVSPDHDTLFDSFQNSINTFLRKEGSF
jgi:hypothetical protein